MKNLLNPYYVSLILLITTCLIQSIILFKNNQLKKIKEKELMIYIEKLENCIDIENKNKRSFYENIQLSEYCIDKFGYFEWYY